MIQGKENKKKTIAKIKEKKKNEKKRTNKLKQKK